MKPSLPARLALMLLGVTLALLLAEGAARLVPMPQSFAWRMAAFRDAVLQPDAALGWQARPDSTVTIGGVLYRFDALGCRGAAPANKPTLLVAGDSMALGWGVAEAETFAGRLATAHPDWQVRNAGMVGYNLEQSVARVAALLPVLRPQRVLLTYFANDAEARGGEESALARHSALFRLARPALLGLGAQLGFGTDVTAYHAQLHAPGSPGWQRVEAGFGQLAALCEAAQVACTVALVPELQRQPYGLADVHARLAALARARGLAVVDLAPAIADVPPHQLWVMPDDAHPNAEAHRRFAQALAGVLP